MKWPKKYAIRDIEEAKAYLNHETLGDRLREISDVLLNLSTDITMEIFGSPDNFKLKSCMTLFAQVDEPNGVFQQVLDKFFCGTQDKRTILMINNG